MLKIQRSDHSSPAFWVMEKSVTIGSGKSSSIILENNTVNESHAKLIRQNNSIVLKDLGSSIGTQVNGQRINQKQLFFGDRFIVGDVEFKVLDPTDKTQPNSAHKWSLIADSSWLSGQEFPLVSTSGSKVITIGRGKQCDLVFPGTHLSREHAKVVFHDNHITFTDLNSSNGTYVNESKITGETKVKAGDRVRLDVYSFRVFGPGIDFTNMIKRSNTGSHPVISDNMISESKKWKTKPTSVGNREELSHYDKNYTWLYALIIFFVFTGFITYFFLG